MRHVLCTLLLVGLFLAACGHDTPRHVPRPLRIGERLPTSIRMATLADPETPSALHLGNRATVFYAWSVPCPCIESSEYRIQKLMRKYDVARGVAWFAVAGEPHDTLEQIREKKLRLGSTYPILLDPEQDLCTTLSLESACEVAVVDGDGRMAYGGALDDDYVQGEGEYLEEALDAVLDDRPVEVPEREPSYGCVFNDPASCPQSER